MSKALEILKEPLFSLPKDGGGFIFSYEAKDIQNVIFIIEEAIKPKTCDGCIYFEYDDDDVLGWCSNGVSHCNQIGNVENWFCCNQFEPKDSE